MSMNAGKIITTDAADKSQGATSSAAMTAGGDNITTIGTTENLTLTLTFQLPASLITPGADELMLIKGPLRVQGQNHDGEAIGDIALTINATGISVLLNAMDPSSGPADIWPVGGTSPTGTEPPGTGTFMFNGR